MQEQTKKMVEERAREILKTINSSSLQFTGTLRATYDDVSQTVKDLLLVIATQQLASELRCIIEELRSMVSYEECDRALDRIIRRRISQLTEQLKDLGEL